jgi:hypothetical protein
MANLYSPDPLQTGGKRWDVLAKNSSQDGDYSWQSFDTALGKNMADMWQQSFGWKNKDYALLALFDPQNVTRLDRHMENGYILGSGIGHGNYTTAWEVRNIPQNYHTLKITGQIYKDRQTAGSGQWLTMRANDFSTTNNALYNTWWARPGTTGTSNVTGTSQWYIARGWQEQYWAPGVFEITFQGYSNTEVQNYITWQGWQNNRQDSNDYGYWGRGELSQQAQSPWTTNLQQLRFQMDAGYISGNSWIAVYGIK